MRLGLDGMTTRSALFTDSSNARPWGGVDQHPVDGVVEPVVDPAQVRGAAGAADITSNGNGSPSSSALYHQSFASPCTSASTTVLLAPGLVHEGAGQKHGACGLHAAAPLPVANAMTIGSRFFLSFIGFSLFWFYGFSVFTGSGIAVSSRLKALPCAST